MTFVVLMIFQTILVVLLEYTLLKANSELDDYYESNIGIMTGVGLVGLFPVLGAITSLILLFMFWSNILGGSGFFNKVPKLKKKDLAAIPPDTNFR